MSLKSLLGYFTVSWDGMLILTGDVNIDMLSPLHYLAKRYQTILYVFGLTQVVTHPTRITKTAKTLIDHLIKNYPQKVTDSKRSRRHLRLHQCPFAPLSTVSLTQTGYEKLQRGVSCWGFLYASHVHHIIFGRSGRTIRDPQLPDSRMHRKTRPVKKDTCY